MAEPPPLNAMVRQVRPKPPTPQAEVTITLKEIVWIVRRHLWMIIFFTAGGIVFGGVSWYLMQRYFPKYTANTAIEVLSPVRDDPMAFSGSPPNKDAAWVFRNTKAGFMKQQSFLQELLRKDVMRETQWYAQFDSNIAEAIDNLKANLRASPQRDLNWITVSMTCGGKKESALIVNEMIDLFLKKQHENATRDISDQLKERKNHMDNIKRNLDTQEGQLKTLRMGTDFINIGKGSFRGYLDESISAIERNHNELEAVISNLESTISTLSERIEGEIDAIVREQVEQDPIASGLRSRISNLKPFLAQQLTRFGENHRSVRETRDNLKQLEIELADRQQMIADIRRHSTLQSALDQKTSFTAQIETLEKQRLDVKREYRELTHLKAEYEKVLTKRDEQQRLLEEITAYIGKLTMQFEDPEVAKVRSTGLAPEPLRMSSPKLKLYVPAGFMLGLMAGLGLAFAIELLNDLLRTPSDAMKHLSVPLLGAICHINEDDEVEDVDLYHVVRQAPYSIMSECYRQLKANFKLSDPGKHKTLFITSCDAGCGKTSVAVNLATTFIAEDKKVLLIDTNFRKPATMTIFPSTEADGSVAEHTDFGLSNYLLGQCEHDDIIRPSGIEGLDIIDSGPLPPNPAAILSSENMNQLLDKSRQWYDYVIVDGPPTLVSDAKIVAAKTDCTIIVFNTATTRRGTAQRALRELKSVNANIIGSVLIGIRAMKGGYFREKYRLYQEYRPPQLAQPI